jgi:hypothetical protein
VAHVRTQIRNALAAAIADLPSTGASVFASRLYPLQDAELPALLVYSESEDTTPISIGLPRTMERALRIQVEAIAKATVDLDDVLDQICLEVEEALAMPVTTLQDIAKLITLTSTDIEFSEAEKPIGRARMKYTVDYFATENAPDVAL